MYSLFYRAMVMALMGYDCNDHEFWHAFLRVHTFVDLAALFNRRQTDPRAQSILSHWDDCIDFEHTEYDIEGNPFQNEFTYGSLQNYIRMMMHPAGLDNISGNPRPDNIFRWGNTNDTYATANATQRTIITLFPVPGEGGTSTWVYNIAEPGYQYDRIHNPDLSVDESMFHLVSFVL
jgi:hypothetical protein